MDEQRERRTRRGNSTRGGWGLLAVQSIIGAVIVLLALILRLIGGDIYEQLRELFRTAVTDDSLAQSVVEQWEEEGTGGADLPPGTASVLAPPEGATFSPLTLAAVPHRLLDGGTVTSDFGYRVDPIKGGTGFHTGVDIAAPVGTRLYALYDGTVTKAGWDNSYGRYLVLTCGELELWYTHCSALLMEAGEAVSAGEMVAKVGSTGDSTGPHVHLMVRKDGKFYDPSPLIPDDCYA